MSIVQLKIIGPKSVYRPRTPKSGLLYQTINANFDDFLMEAKSNEKIIPDYVLNEFDSYLKCGILEHGFIKLECETCNTTQLVAFSCKKRGFCPSCIGKRMNEGSLFLVDHVFPKVSVRQWVLSFPMPVRFWMARNPQLMSSLLNIYMRAIHRFYKQSVREALGSDVGRSKMQTGSITVIQRFGSALNLNVHFHSLFLDGAYVTLPNGEIEFFELPPMTTQQVQSVLEKIQTRMIRHLQKHGLVARSEADGGGDQSVDETPLISEVQGASVLYKISQGKNAGQKIRKIGSLGTKGEEAFAVAHLSAILGGFSLHATVFIEKDHRDRLQKLCKYLLRPPVAENRLKKLNNGEILFEMKASWGDGTRAILFSPKELIEKLVAIIPQPRIHQIRFHGILAPSATDRERVVPSKLKTPIQKEMFQPSPKRTTPRLSWAELLKRTFQMDMNECAICGGTVKFVKAVIKRDEIIETLQNVGPLLVPV
jgi:hypothetical protein